MTHVDLNAASSDLFLSVIIECLDRPLRHLDSVSLSGQDPFQLHIRPLRLRSVMDILL